MILGVIERVVADLGPEFPRGRIEQVVRDAAASYRDASVTSFVPIFLRRSAVELLARERTAVATSAVGSRVAVAPRRVPTSS